eukprot:GHVR01048529.1.p1 GENE.GHVR01048529.1~~GHVR01048529.1.p1  ORF type:complete len:156 (-),score=40.34 GHVR01048529.1:213-680(-)
MMRQGVKSSLHRLKSDELWHLYNGKRVVTIECDTIESSSTIKASVIGLDISKGEAPWKLFSRGVWFSAFVPPIILPINIINIFINILAPQLPMHDVSSFFTTDKNSEKMEETALVGASVSPAFDWCDWEKASSDQIGSQLPHDIRTLLSELCVIG